MNKHYLIADAHCDTLSKLAWPKNLPENCTITAERMKEGGVAIQTFAMFAGGKGPSGAPYVLGRIMLSEMQRAGVPFLLDKLPDEIPQTPHGIISIEGGEMLEGSLEKFHEFDRDGRIRMIALTWNNENEIGCPAKYGPDGGLKPFGKRLLREMDKYGCLPDVSHLNEAGFWDIVDCAELPPIASHSNARAVCDHFRNLTDRQIRAIIEKKGFIGMNFCAAFVDKKRPVTGEDLFRHIDHIAQLGGIGVLGFGSDFDGISEWPVDLANPLDFPGFLDLLASHGYTEQDITAIAHGNMYRVLKEAEKKRSV